VYTPYAGGTFHIGVDVDKASGCPRLLREAGLSIDSLTNMDLVDAALCALTVHHLLAGFFKTYGDAAEGFIVMPKS